MAKWCGCSGWSQKRTFNPCSTSTRRGRQAFPAAPPEAHRFPPRFPSSRSRPLPIRCWLRAAIARFHFSNLHLSLPIPPFCLEYRVRTKSVSIFLLLGLSSPTDGALVLFCQVHSLRGRARRRRRRRLECVCVSFPQRVVEELDVVSWSHREITTVATTFAILHPT